MGVIEEEIKQAVKCAIAQILDEVTRGAKRSLEKKIRARAVKLTSNIARCVEVETMTDRIVVTFRQIENNNP